MMLNLSFSFFFFTVFVCVLLSKCSIDIFPINTYVHTIRAPSKLVVQQKAKQKKEEVEEKI